MKMILKLLLLLCIPVALVSCGPELYLQKRTDRLIRRLNSEADTVFQYNIAFNCFNYVWYQDAKSLHIYHVLPYSIKRHIEDDVQTIPINENLDKYFNVPIVYSADCFNPPYTLFGERITMYINGKKPQMCCIDLDCLHSKEYLEGSFQYYLIHNLEYFKYYCYESYIHYSLQKGFENVPSEWKRD